MPKFSAVETRSFISSAWVDQRYFTEGRGGDSLYRNVLVEYYAKYQLCHPPDPASVNCERGAAQATPRAPLRRAKSEH